MLHLGLGIDLASQGFHIGDIFDLSVVHDIENGKKCILHCMIWHFSALPSHHFCSMQFMFFFPIEGGQCVPEAWLK